MKAWVGYGTCTPKLDITEGIAPGDTWTATTPGCRVKYIDLFLTGPDGQTLHCTRYVSDGTTNSLFFINMDDVGGCFVKSAPTTECAGDYGSNVPCCGSPELGTVSHLYQCPQSTPKCVHYVAYERWGTCVNK